MKFTPLHASLMALALFAAAGSAHAATGAAEPGMVLAQADGGEATAEIEQIRKFLASGRDLSRLDDDRLQQRLKRAERFQKTDGLPPELAGELDQEVAALKAEFERRQQAAAEPPAAQPEVQPEPAPPEPPKVKAEEPPPEVQPQPQEQVTEQPQQQAEPEQQAQATEDAAGSQDSEEVTAFLASVRPASELTAEELRQQMQRASELSKTKRLSKDQRRALRDVIRDARAELRGKDKASEQPNVTEQAEPPKPAEQAAAPQQPVSGDVTAFLATVKPASQLSEEELRQQMRRATELAGTEGLPAEQRQALRDVIREARGKLRGEGGDTQQTTEQPQTGTQQQAQEPPKQTAQPAAVDPEMERKALAILNDTVDVRSMKRRELRERLSGIRDLLASDQLSPATKDALRKKLAAERQVLRNEVSEGEGGGRPAQQGGQNQPPEAPKSQGGSTQNNNVIVNNNTVTNTEVRVVLQDRRPPDALDEDELVRRIDVYRDVVDDERYAEAERRAWERELARDRRELRRRMLDDRRVREERLRTAEINIDIGDEYDPDREVQDDVFAAEVDDEELADVLAAPPRRKVQRRYTVDEIARSPEARDAVARIEIDTVHFGFGEGFLREEEIDKLDRIAQVLERILAKNPGEVFMIEGHTDAVGSDAANMQLSRQRAQAVKEALTTYYVIPAENLKTVGLGERYLKIPTQLAEAENRRVSLARITALVGQAD